MFDLTLFCILMFLGHLLPEFIKSAKNRDWLRATITGLISTALGVLGFVLFLGSKI